MRSIKIIIFLFLGSLLAPSAFAESPAPCPSDSTFGCFEVGLPGSSELTAGKSIDSFVGGKDTKPILKFIGVAVNVVIAALVIIGVISVVIGGYMYMTAGGNGDQVKSAKSWIQSALVGIFLSLISVVVLNTINKYLGSEAAEPELGETGTGTSGAGAGGAVGTGTGGGAGSGTGPGNNTNTSNQENSGSSSGSSGSLPPANNTKLITPAVIEGGLLGLQEFSTKSNDLIVTNTPGDIQAVVFNGKTYNPYNNDSLTTLVRDMEQSGVITASLKQPGAIQDGSRVRVVRTVDARASAWQSVQSFLVSPSVNIRAENVILPRDLVTVNPPK